ncbi:MAG: LysR substrate-binding domain-containing protein, partial [Solirubrobacteraceae bacterium]|nr:LysR substrate-binding domain-containing protein [Solirubrobacteraceae bacterium]
RDAPLRNDARYKRVDLFTDQMDIVLPADHPLATPEHQAGGLRLERLAGERWVSSAPTDPCSMITTAVCAVAGFSPDIRHHTQEWDAAAALVAAGAGVALVPRLAQPLRPSGLVTVPVLGSAASRLIFAITRAGVQSSPPAFTVLEALVQVAAERPDAA